MGLIRKSEAEIVATRAVRLHLGDLAHAGAELRRAAEAEAERTRAEARAERERIMAGAAEAGRAQGWAQGHAEGLALGRREGAEAARAERAEALGALERAWAGALEQFERERRGMLDEARRDVVALAALVAGLVTRRVVELDARRIEPMLEAVLERVASPTRVMIQVHPEDLSVAREALPALVHRLGTPGEVEVRAVDGAPRGSCVARLGGGGAIDASVSTQIERMVEALVGREPEGDDASGGVP